MSTYTILKPTIHVPTSVVISKGRQDVPLAKLNQAMTGFIQFMLRYPAYCITTYALALRGLVLNLTGDMNLANRAMDLFNQCNRLTPAGC